MMIYHKLLKYIILLYCIFCLLLFAYLTVQIRNRGEEWTLYSMRYSALDSEVSLSLQKLRPDDNKNSITDTINRNGRNPPVIFVLGGPGSGKGTQCRLIARDFQFEHISVGEIMRNEVESRTKEGQLIKNAIEQGEIVPLNLTIELLIKTMKDSRNANGYLIDGFPRNITHGPLFEKQIGPCDLVLMLDCTEQTMIRRILQRADTSNRPDDNEITLKKRLLVYKKQTIPVIEYYQSIGKVVKVDTERLIDEVYADIKKIIEECLMRQQS